MDRANVISKDPAYFGTGCPDCVLPAVEIDTPVTTLAPETTIEYVPYLMTYYDTQAIEKIERVPREVVSTEYDTVTRRGRRPVERVVTDYYTIEHITDYELDYETERKIEYVPQEVIRKKVEYVPYERQIVHYPSALASLPPSVPVPMPATRHVSYVDNQSVKSNGSVGIAYKITTKHGQVMLDFRGDLKDTWIF
jgi:hypothetical protein